MTGQMEIVALTCRSACKGEADLIERIKKAMREAVNHWMVVDDDARFLGAVGAAMLESNAEEKARIERSFRPLKYLSAMLSGVPVDPAALDEFTKAEDIIPLMKMWHEIKAANA